MVVSLVYGSASSIKIIDDKVIKTTFYFFKREYGIEEMKWIEAVTEKKFGYITIRIGKSYAEDYYILQMKNRSSLKVNAAFKNSGVSLGRYLKKKYKLQLKETERLRF